MKILILLSSILFTCVSVAEPPGAELTTLSNAELQKFLGVTAISVELPTDFGDFYNLYIAVYKDGDLKILGEGGGRVPEGRKLAIAIQDTESGLVVSELAGAGYSPITIPQMYFDGLKDEGTYSNATVAGGAKNGKLILSDRIYYRAKLAADGVSFSTNNPEDKKIGRCVIYLKPNRV